ncbi:unnamed protein product [Aureobasidium uvarum]|uniref:Uncharacterized protein n=1 Tax=Aureobasidium uvarum TaxID=2773716 RepID=A0A9N8KR55_9PEZI|nr:unnamed protein product [Aureobasidium uvarum]
MSTPPAPKRRRVDSVGIHKPFVSPLKRNPSTTGPPNQATSTPKPVARTASQAPATPYTPLRSSNLKTSTPLSNHSPEILAAQTQIRALEAQIRDLRSQNGILTQALDITVAPTSSQQQPRLLKLKEKWRKASQQAAEEVFCDFAEKIRDNGGYTAFLKQQSKPKSFFGDEQDTVDETNEEDWRDEEGDCLTERGKRQRRCEIEDRAKKHEEEEEEEEAEEEEELTLGSMLQVLNIPPEVIGWDPKTLAWK